MDVIYARGQATVAEVEAALEDPPSYSSIRALLRILEQKGFLTHREDGPRYVFLPIQPHQEASRSAIRRVLNTFFEGSLANAVAALVNTADSELSAEELRRIESLVQTAKAKSTQSKL